MAKWRRSLRLKQDAWPGHYDFSALIGDPSLRSMTERMVLKYTDYPDLATYLRGYSVTDGVLAPLEVPTRLITSADDPIILARDLERLGRPRSLQVTVTARGGHCGFRDALGGPSWADREILAEFERA
jgi:predicted alpha/beta-fold hydrolase